MIFWIDCRVSVGFLEYRAHRRLRDRRGSAKRSGIRARVVCGPAAFRYGQYELSMGRMSM